jgi:hypothetical protein
MIQSIPAGSGHCSYPNPRDDQDMGSIRATSVIWRDLGPVSLPYSR